MEVTILQDKLGYDFKFRIYVSGKLGYTAKINRTILPNLRKICLYKPDGKEICCLKQESWLKIILRIIPMMCFFKFSVCPYIYYKDGVNQGYFREETNGSGYVYGEVLDGRFEMWENSGNYTSLYCNDKQIGLIERSTFKELDGDSYKITYDRGFDDKLIAMLCLLSDALWHTSDTQVNSLNWESYKQLSGRMLDKDWRPKD